MVWSTTQSTLYGGAERPCTEAVHEPARESARPQPQRSCARPMPRRNDPISALMSDSDALLICAVILLLLHEKADMKLILALVFVLIG